MSGYKKNGYKFLLITDFLPISAHHGPSGFGVRRPHKKIGYKFLLIADIFPISAHHGPSGFVVRRPHQPSSSLYLVQPQCVLQMGKSPNPPYHLPFIDLRVASIKTPRLYYITYFKLRVLFLCYFCYIQKCTI